MAFFPQWPGSGPAQMPTQEGIDQRKKMADALMRASQQPTGLSGPWGGIVAALTGAAAGWQQRRAGMDQKQVDDDWNAKFTEALMKSGAAPEAVNMAGMLPKDQKRALLGQITATKLAPKSPVELKWQDAGNELVGTNPTTGAVVARVPKGIDPALRKTELKDAGGKLVPFDPYAQNQTEVPKSVNPDAQLSSDTTRAGQANTAAIAAANRSTTERGQDITAQTALAGQQANSGKAAKQNTAALRKEFRGLPSVKDYEASLPVIESARNAPDTPAGDLQVVYSVGKILDPNSVVREGELQLTQNATPFLQKIIGKARGELQGQGRLTPQTRKDLMDMLDQRVGGYKQAYARDYDTYSQYGRDIGADPSQIVGTRPESAFTVGGSPPLNTPPAGSLASTNGPPPQTPERTATGPNGEKLVLRNGQWQPAQ